MLDDECSKILNDEDARILIKEGTVFTMRRLSNPYRGYYAVGEYPTVSIVNIPSGKPADQKVYWTIEYAGKVGEYYLKSTSTGYYMTNLTAAGAFLETKKQADAIKFTIGYTDDGGVNFVLAENPESTFGLSDEGKLGILPLNEVGAKWSPTYTKHWKVHDKDSNMNKIISRLEKSIY